MQESFEAIDLHDHLWPSTVDNQRDVTTQRPGLSDRLVLEHVAVAVRLKRRAVRPLTAVATCIDSFRHVVCDGYASPLLYELNEVRISEGDVLSRALAKDVAGA